MNNTFGFIYMKHMKKLFLCSLVTILFACGGTSDPDPTSGGVPTADSTPTPLAVPTPSPTPIAVATAGPSPTPSMAPTTNPSPSAAPTASPDPTPSPKPVVKPFGLSLKSIIVTSTPDGTTVDVDVSAVKSKELTYEK